MWFDFLKRLRNNSSSSRFCLDLNTRCRYNTSICWSGYILVPHQSITALHIQPKCKLPTPKCGLTWQRQQTEDTGKLTTSYSSRKIAAVTGDWKDRPPAEAPRFPWALPWRTAADSEYPLLSHSLPLWKASHPVRFRFCSDGAVLNVDVKSSFPNKWKEETS